MRIIGGIYKNRRVDFKNLNIRPTTDFAKESLFNLLNNYYDFEKICVLDLFAGSGSMGIEALSRGAKYVTFIDNSPDCIKQINKNLQEYKNDYSVLKLDVSNYINEVASKYDIVFYDPPFEYVTEDINADISEIGNNLNKNAFIVIHRHSNSSSIVLPNDVELYKEKYYGQSKILILRKK